MLEVVQFLSIMMKHVTVNFKILSFVMHWSHCKKCFRTIQSIAIFRKTNERRIRLPIDDNIDVTLILSPPHHRISWHLPASQGTFVLTIANQRILSPNSITFCWCVQWQLQNILVDEAISITLKSLLPDAQTRHDFRLIWWRKHF